jgi:uncharacterized protein (TIGR03435 family)
MNIDKPAAAAVLMLSCCFANGQSFEVASIHRNLSGSQNTGINILPGGRISVTNATLKTLIRNAYGILSFQLAGETGWIDSEYFNIEAKTGAGEGLSQEQLKPYLQSLLADRFHLRVHWESREATVYALLVDKAGPKLKVSSSDEIPSVDTGREPDKMHITCVAQPISVLTQNLGNRLERIVTDKTGLISNYDFAIEWDPQSGAESAGPSLFTVLKEKLGLRLETQKGQIETLVVDRAERPSEN